MYLHPQGFQIHLNLDDAAAAERIFAQLADGGQVTVPLQETFWAQRFGAVVDRFGVPWGITCGERGSGLTVRNPLQQKAVASMESSST